MPVNAAERGNAIGRGGQLRSNFSILRRPALQRKQADNHLRAVQQSMIGLLVQNHHLSDQLVLLMKQRLFSRESLAQLDFRAPTSGQLTFAAFDRAMLLAVNYLAINYND